MPTKAKYATAERNEKISLLVFHCFALSTKQMTSVLQKTGTSVHYIIQRNGKILNLVDENMVAFHAGLSSWHEFETGINAKSVGIELQNSAMGNKPYTKAQIKSLIELSKQIINRHKIKNSNIVGHSDIAPFRKPDPSKFFPWEDLAKNGIGIWPEIKKIPESFDSLPKKDVEKMLHKIGYNTIDLTSALYAFATRFMPHKVSVNANIIKKEAEIFAYWQKIKSSDIAQNLKNAPKIYPQSAENLFKDRELIARLREVSEAYERKN